MVAQVKLKPEEYEVLLNGGPSLNGKSLGLNGMDTDKNGVISAAEVNAAMPNYSAAAKLAATYNSYLPESKQVKYNPDDGVSPAELGSIFTAVMQYAKTQVPDAGKSASR